MSNIRGLLELGELLDAMIRELKGVAKGLYERLDENILRWFGHIKGIENDRTAKKVYVGECVGSHLVGR